MQHDVTEVETHSANVLIAEGTLFCSPLESCAHRVLDLSQVLHSTCGIDEEVGAFCFRSKCPDPTSFGNVPAVLLNQVCAACLYIVSWGDGAGLDILGEALLEGTSFHVQPVVLVWRLGQAHLVRLSNNRLTERDNRF